MNTCNDEEKKHQVYKFIMVEVGLPAIKEIIYVD